MPPIRIDRRVAEDDVVRVTLQDKDGAVLFEGDARQRRPVGRRLAWFPAARVGCARRMNLRPALVVLTAAALAPAGCGDHAPAAGAPVDSRRLVDVIVADDVVQIEARLRQGAIDVATTDEDGRTLLHNAVSGGATRVARMLIGRGVSLRARNRWGMGPLSDAVRTGHLEMIDLLVTAGADINEQDNQGMTPLHHAILANSPTTEGMLGRLLALGADIDRKNEWGESPRKWMLEHSDYRKLVPK